MSETIQQSRSKDRRSLITALVARITIATTSLILQIRRQAFLQWLGYSDRSTHGDTTSAHHEITVPISLRRRGVEAKLILGNDQQNKTVDPLLVSTIANAHSWFGDLVAGRKLSINDIAKDQGLGASEITRLLPLAFLAPDIVEAIIAGKQPTALTTKRLKRLRSLSFDWDQQRESLGFFKRLQLARAS